MQLEVAVCRHVLPAELAAAGGQARVRCGGRRGAVIRASECRVLGRDVGAFEHDLTHGALGREELAELGGAQLKGHDHDAAYRRLAPRKVAAQKCDRVGALPLERHSERCTLL
eukprot:3741657-Prymnesium_polylepis.1